MKSTRTDASRIPSRQRLYENPLWLLLILSAINVFNTLDRHLIAILLPSIKDDLQISDSQIGLMTGPAFAVFYAVLALPLGILAERVNRSSMVAVAISVWSFMTVVSGLATSFLHLVVARVGVAMGEAGGSPPSYGMISDAFAQKWRPTAMAVFTAAASLGGALALFGGGWMSETWGWRSAFLVAGASSFAFAPIIFFFVKDPQRGFSDHATQTNAIPVREAFRLLRANRTFRQLAIAGTLSAFCVYALTIWLPSFLARSYGLGPAAAGGYLGAITLVGALGGTFAGGELARLAGTRSVVWWSVVPALGFLVGAPILLLGIFADNLPTTLTCLMVGTFLVHLFPGPLFAIVTSIVPAGMRSVASSTLLFSQIAFGLGLGPLLTGSISDLSAEKFGAEGLRYALVAPLVIGAWSGLHYLLSGRTLRDDTAAALNHSP